MSTTEGLFILRFFAVGHFNQRRHGCDRPGLVPRYVLNRTSTVGYRYPALLSFMFPPQAQCMLVVAVLLLSCLSTPILTHLLTYIYRHTMSAPPPPRRALGKDTPPSTSTVDSGSSTRLFATKDNTGYKWQRARGVVGALEVSCEPVLRLRDDMTPRYVAGREKTFQDALQAWEDMKLREAFIQACESLPAEVCCCGIMRDDETTIKEFVPLLNDTWCKVATKKLMKRGIKVDAFLWNWQNASGKAETNILLIRFWELSSYRFRRASNSGSLDFELVSVEEGEIGEGGGDAQPVNQQEMARS
jgi:hypothetical protein